MYGATVFGTHEISHLLHQSLADVMKRGGAISVSIILDTMREFIQE